MDEGKVEHNPDNYRRMSEPHADGETAQRELAAFMNGVLELRKRHRMADVMVVIRLNAMLKDKAGVETEVPMMMHGHFGDSTHAEMLAAYAMGAAKADREQMLEESLEEAKANTKAQRRSKR